MKKLFTLFAMLTLAVSVMAQTINYQAVLRDNTDSSLVRNQTGTVVVTVLRVDETTATLYSGPFTTNASGMTNLTLNLAGLQAEVFEIGESNIPGQTINPNQTSSDVTPVQPVKPAQIDWRNNEITAVFTYGDNKTITLVTPVTAVPYAVQAKDADLTTSTIVTYINRYYDMERIWRAVKGNENLHNAMRDSIANFLKQKENYEYAKEILYSYISQVTAADLNEAYGQLQELSQETKNAIDTALKNFLKSNRNLAIEVAEYYAQTATEDEMRTIYNDLKANEPAATKIKELMDQYFAHYLAYKGLVCTNTTNGNPPTLCDVVTAMSQSGSSTPAPVAYDFSTVNVGDVIHVNDVITITETAAYETGGFSLVYWQSPFTLVRANVTLPAQPGLGEATVVESADGAYYIFKDKDGNYYGLYTDNLNACKATATSDGLVITQKTQVPPSNVPYTEYTIRFETHEP